MSEPDELLLTERDAVALLGDLADALTSEIPSAHLDDAVDAFWMARTDALVAEIDEHLSSGLRASVRSTTVEREMRFRHDDLVITLTVDPVDRRIDGHVDGPCTGASWLDADGGSRPINLDESGRFRMVHRGGPASVEVSLASGDRVRTRWTLL